jgi:Ran GTPase-activating protein (RanGAP) involved in mRNA processing and transport
MSYTNVAIALRLNTTATKFKMAKTTMGSTALAALADALQTKTLTLVEVNLVRCCITRRGATLIAKALMNNKSLTILDLSFNRIGDEGVAVLADALAINTTLAELHLQSVGMSSSGLAAIAEALKTNTSLQKLVMRLERVGTDRGAVLVQDSAVCNLADALEIHPTLELLAIYSVGMGDDGARAIAKALRMQHSLKHLDMSDNPLTVAGVAAVADALKTNSTLEILYLQNVAMEEDGARAIAEALLTNPSLQVLDISDNHIGTAGVSAVANALATNNALKKISLCMVELELEAALAIAKALRTNRSLKELDMSFNDLSVDEAVVAIASTLETNNTLEEIRLQDVGMTAVGVRAISRALRANQSLKLLDLSHNDFTDHWHVGIMEDFALTLARNVSLEALLLSYSGLNSRGIEALARALRTNQTLRKLDLAVCCFRDGGRDAVAALTGALRENRTLSFLDLRTSDRHKLSALEVRGLGLAIRDNPRINTLHLHGVRLCAVAVEIGLPSHFKHSSNAHIMDEISIVWRGKLLAFAMGMHPRLGCGGGTGTGAVPRVFALNENVFKMIAESYWGVPS